VATRAELRRPGFKGGGAISPPLRGAGAGAGAATGAAALTTGLTGALAGALAAGLAAGLAEGFATGFGADLAAGFDNVFGTGLTGLATALAFDGTGLAAVFLAAAGAGFLAGAAFAAGLALATGLAGFFTGLAAALGAGLAFTAVLATGLAEALAAGLVFFAWAFTMCLLWKAVSGPLSGPWDGFLAKPLLCSSTLPVARFPGLSAACQS